ncbi:DNA repair protein RadC [Denitrovibrio acetiphilus DSM 12809]|uniref:DNA repair protein RadC n=1 Tax=Denitrovibrio acetiphilus (strain DSM 12809 / NBRC 114555 / N2460) TaxID=522772 RepID=D4H3V4_DENA2|nr:DNA repair protein RadC [Denitrovibrio acetiphilus]ADD69206.1 DNA repair protein RadC [Denitrovibrio acetiphilus DSM 12809]
MKEHYHGHRNRLKKRFSKEPESLYDYEVLELLLGYVLRGRDVKPQAKELLERAGSLSAILGYDTKNIKGLGEEAQMFFGAIREFFARLGYEDIDREAVIIDKPEKAAQFLKYKIAYDKKEHFVALFLDVNKKLLGFENLFKGTVDRLAVYPREIAERAITSKATHVIVAHNHPSGNMSPSETDITLTDKLIKALAALDINLADHIIITTKGFYSFKREQVI